MFLTIKKKEHKITRDDFRYTSTGRQVTSDVSRPLTRAELLALAMERDDIDITPRFYVRFELREAYRVGKDVRNRWVWGTTVEGEHIHGTGQASANACEKFWSRLNAAIKNESEATKERIRKQAEAVFRYS